MRGKTWTSPIKKVSLLIYTLSAPFGDIQPFICTWWSSEWWQQIGRIRLEIKKTQFFLFSVFRGYLRTHFQFRRESFELFFYLQNKQVHFWRTICYYFSLLFLQVNSTSSPESYVSYASCWSMSSGKSKIQRRTKNISKSNAIVSCCFWLFLSVSYCIICFLFAAKSVHHIQLTASLLSAFRAGFSFSLPTHIALLHSLSGTTVCLWVSVDMFFW